MALGKNLDNILGDYFGEENITLNGNKNLEIIELEIEKISTSPYQTRKVFSEDKIISLAKSIEQTGLLNPVIVLKKIETEDDGTRRDSYTLLAGERRVKAFQSLGKANIPAIIKEEGKLPQNEQAMITAYENLHREDLSPLELAKTFKMLMDTQNLNGEDVAERLGFSKQYIKNYLNLLTLNETVQKALLDGKLTEGQARHLVNLPDIEQLELLQIILEGDLTVKEIIAYLKQQKAKTEVAKKTKHVEIHRINQEIVNKANKICEYFEGSKLKIQGDHKKGKIVITWG